MKLFYSTVLLLLGIQMLVPVHSIAQDRRFYTRQQIDSIMNPALLAHADQVISFGKTVVNIGQLTEDDQPVEVVYPFQNIGREDLVVTGVRTFCGCTAATVGKEVYRPGESGSIVIRYMPKNHPGTINESAFVFSSLSETSPIAKLTIIGEVLPGADYWSRYRYSMGTLRLKQQTLNFRFQGRRKLVERILCGNSGNAPLKLSVSGLPAYMQFYTEPTEILPGEEADIVVKVDLTHLNLQDGKQRIEEELLLEGLSIPEQDRKLKVIIDLSEIEKLN